MSFTEKFTPTTPSDSRMASSCLSVRFRVEGQIACAHACVATRNVALNPATSQKPFSLGWGHVDHGAERLQALTESFPEGVSPGPVSGERGHPLRGRKYWGGSRRARANGDQSGIAATGGAVDHPFADG